MQPGVTARAAVCTASSGPSAELASPPLMPRLGVEGLFADKDHVIGGSERTQVAARRNLSRSWFGVMRCGAIPHRPQVHLPSEQPNPTAAPAPCIRPRAPSPVVWQPRFYL